MTPALPARNPVSVTYGNTEASADIYQICPGFSHAANCSDVILGEFGPVMTQASTFGAVSDLVSRVLFWRRPTKVSRAVVVAISIPVRGLMELRRLGSMKCRADDDVYPLTPGGTQIEHLVFPPLDNWLQHGPRKEASLSVTCRDPAIHRPHASQARRLIANVAGYLAPFFNFVYRIISHIALLQRVGQGMTEGCNQPSFPIYNRQRLRSSSITLLAARV